MARNIEIKAAVASVAVLLGKIADLPVHTQFEIEQDDTFFPVPRGRLKLRAFADGSGELIFYERPDVAGPKSSSYELAPVAAAEPLRRALTAAYGQAGRVRKQRRVFLVGRTRIHVDRVEGLGDYLELEVVLEEGEATAAGEQEALQWMDALGIMPDQLVDCAYIDLLHTRLSGSA
jgi:predicted adenylyl cyclase CyaB